MAAAVFDFVAVPRAAAALPRAAAPPRMAVALPECRGLRIGRRAVRVSSSSSVARRSVRRAVVCEVQDTALDVPDVTTDTWQSLVLESSVPVLVEFWAPWCGPCRIILPVIGELSRQYAGKLRCYKINTDECPELATQFGIRSIPTIMIFKNGDKKDTVIGAVPKSALITCIEKFL